MIPSWMWFQAMAMGPVAAGAPMGTTWSHGVGSLQRDLQADHAAQGPAGHEREPLDAEARRRARQMARASSRAVGCGKSAPHGSPVAGLTEVGPVDP